MIIYWTWTPRPSAKQCGSYIEISLSCSLLLLFLLIIKRTMWFSYKYKQFSLFFKELHFSSPDHNKCIINPAVPADTTNCRHAKYTNANYEWIASFSREIFPLIFNEIYASHSEHAFLSEKYGQTPCTRYNFSCVRLFSSSLRRRKNETLSKKRTFGYFALTLTRTFQIQRIKCEQSTISLSWFEMNSLVETEGSIVTKWKIKQDQLWLWKS